ncbi:hypothetical protein F2Q69_00020394 [Brassica cretica]|uniref:Uncharacterized protein n=1 Tax=Brassica cretica TaxID=69181 RepID=A0A8S9QE77_BRACR|nr:hypothetical protein F2Q69_00020394 [Brassica cretica]
MIDSPSRFEDDAWTVIWLFPGWRLGICRFRENCQKRIGFKTTFMSRVFLFLGSELDMRGDRFSIFGEFRSVCKI